MMRAIVICALLAGCAAPPPVTITKIKLVQPDIPAALLDCPGDPVVPVAARQSQVAAYIAQLWEAHAICANHLGAVRRTLQATASTR
ncbi:MAG: hypothetical protein PHI71_04010 [Acidiphilium sp.]|jgi:hypothetical protein|nr:hypothetical protein [Acidiphilium sp.]